MAETPSEEIYKQVHSWSQTAVQGITSHVIRALMNTNAVITVISCVTQLVYALSNLPVRGYSTAPHDVTSSSTEDHSGNTTADHELRKLWRDLVPARKPDDARGKHGKDESNKELAKTLKAYDSKIRQINSYVIKPEHWMLDFFDQVNVAVVKRQYEYMRGKRDQIQEIMNEAHGFIALTALTSPGHLDEGQVCTEKGLSAVINEFIRRVHQTPLEVIKIVKLLRMRLLRYFYHSGTWDEQVAADLYTFFKIMIGTKNHFDEMAAGVEAKWERLFEETREKVIAICHVEVGEVGKRIHEAIGDSWEKLKDTHDVDIDEDKILEGILEGQHQLQDYETNHNESHHFNRRDRPNVRALRRSLPRTNNTKTENICSIPDWHLRLFNTIRP